MKIAVLNTSVPFLTGGAEQLASGLVQQLSAKGHEVEHVKVPLRWSNTDVIAESMFAAASLRIPTADCIIALKFPAYLVPHHNKVVWLLHQFRQVYDLRGTEWQDLPSTAGYRHLARAIQKADDLAFSEARSLFSISATVDQRLQLFNRRSSVVLPPPLGNPAMFRPGEYGDYLLAIGRINRVKRQHLLIEAMTHVHSDIRLVVAGSPETSLDLRQLQEIIETNGLGSRVQLIPRFISETEKADLLSGARAVAYIPRDEDGYGYVTMEGMLSGKAILTASDSGGVLELVEHNVTGIVSEPSVRQLAAAIESITDADTAVSLGEGAYGKISETKTLSWDEVIPRLLG